MDTQKKEETKREKPLPIKKGADLQRLKLEKLMKNMDKPVVIPERPKEKGSTHVPDFVRNVMGSSAGAGSGEFHVYRHLRRKEYARQKFIQQKSEKELLDEAYKKKLEENAKLAEERTAKKRAKRLKKKEKMRNKPKIRKVEGQTVNHEQEESSDESVENDDGDDHNKSSEDNEAVHINEVQNKNVKNDSERR